eukprot:2545-Heterococcus_DN1.PRE.1
MILWCTAMRNDRDNLYDTATHYGRTDRCAVLEAYRAERDPQLEKLLAEQATAVARAHAAAASSCSSKQMLRAIGRGNTDAVQQLLDSSDWRGRLVDTKEHTALHAAAAMGSLHCTALLLHCHLDVHARSSDGHTPLDMAMSNALSAELRSDCTGVADFGVPTADQQAVTLLLLHCGAYPNAHTEHLHALVLARVAEQFVNTLQQQVKLQEAVLAAYATAAFVASNSASVTVPQPTVATLHVNGSSAEHKRTVFSFDTAVLAKLLAVHTGDSQCILMNLVLPERWRNAAAVSTGSSEVVHSTCDGKHYNITVKSLTNTDICNSQCKSVRIS